MKIGLLLFASLFGVTAAHATEVCIIQVNQSRPPMPAGLCQINVGCTVSEDSVSGPFMKAKDCADQEALTIQILLEKGYKASTGQCGTYVR